MNISQEGRERPRRSVGTGVRFLELKHLEHGGTGRGMNLMRRPCLTIDLLP